MTNHNDHAAEPNWGLMPDAIIAQLKKREWDSPARLKARLKGDISFPIVISLKPPKSGNQLLKHPLHFHEFVAAWRSFTPPNMVQWQQNRFRHFSEQLIPTALIVPDIQFLADMLGASTRQQLKRWHHKISYLHSDISEDILSSPTSHTNKLIDDWQKTLFIALIDKLDVIDKMDNSGLDLLVRLVPQLQQDMGTNLYLRALPVRYVDTKFIETYQKLIEAILDALYDDSINNQGLIHWLGCLDKPTGWLMVRPLCADSSAALSGLPILRLPTDILFNQALPADRILIVENEQSCLALPKIASTIAIAGAGKNINWMRADWLQQKTAAYWGDIDSEGLMMLSRAKAYCPNLKTLMMDEQTLKQFSDRMVDEPDSIHHDPTHLTKAELTLFKDLRQGKYGDKRLEQERLPNEYIEQAIKEWLNKTTSYPI